LELIEPPFDRPNRSDHRDERKIRRAMVSWCYLGNCPG
jgi:hypothetical protein